MSRIVQFFSRISKRLRKKECRTLPALEKHVEIAHTPMAGWHFSWILFMI